MFPVIFIGLFVSVLAVFTVVCAMFFSVAFETEEQAMFSPSIPGTARLPHRYSQPSTTSSANAGRKASLMRDIRSAKTARPEQQLACRHSRDVIPVTAREVFAIADYVNMSRTREEVEQIYQAADANERQCTPGHLGCDQPCCPLLKTDGSCAVHPVRPQYCHLAERHESSLGGSAQEMASAVEDFRPAHLRADGGEACYELNSALAAALSDPEAEQLRQIGTQLFANCRRVS